MKSLLQPWVARTLSSNQLLISKRWLAEKQRLRAKQPHTVDVFIKVDDPYSYILLQALTSFEQRYSVKFEYHIVANQRDDMFPESKLWNDNAFRDAAYLAELYDFSYPAKLVNQANDATTKVARQLLDISKQGDFSQQAVTVLQRYWAGDVEANQPIKDPANELAKNEKLLEDMGHYFSAMMHYNGEWYWGVDRLAHLEARLNTLGLSQQHGKPELIYDKGIRHFCQRLELNESNTKRPETPLTLFFSARSPYSYLGLERAAALARHYDVPLTVKPVLPMMMRNMNVPSTKKWYIFHDTKREAKRMGLDYGFVADPLGEAVERCYALFEYASSNDKAVDFLLSFARAVNAQGIRAETDTGLKHIVENCGLEWSTAQTLLANSSWRDWADANYAELYDLGLWGVPCLQYGDLAVWGQDRIDVIEQAICRSISAIN